MKAKYFKPVVFVICLLPAARLVFDGLRSQLGANPIEMITHETGDWTMIWLMCTLAITPLRRIPGANGLIAFRRMLGLFAFFYGTLHFLTYIWLDKFFDMHEIVKDVYKRPFITAGFTGFVLMIPLAVTSTKGWIRRLGKKWIVLHRLIYATALAGVVHYIWLVKKDEAKPFFYAFIFSVLMLWRVGVWFVQRAKANSSKVPARGLPSEG